MPLPLLLLANCYEDLRDCAFYEEIYTFCIHQLPWLLKNYIQNYLLECVPKYSEKFVLC